MAMAGLSAKELSENAMLMVLGRLAMIVLAIAVPIFGFIGQQYLQDQKDRWSELSQSVKEATSAVNQRVDSIDKALSNRIDIASRDISGIDSRVTVLETTTQVTSTAAANDRTSVSSELRDLRSTVEGLANQVSALNATLTTMTHQPSPGRP